VREVTVPGAAPGAPYFLISYSHTERYGQGLEREPDAWVIKFYTDLCRNVEELAAVPPGTRVGVLDRAWWVEHDWRAGLPEALASCRVLVPLYSPRYFQSDACGKEWQTFAVRPAGLPGQARQAPAIVPVMWSPMTAGSVPWAARSVPIEFGGVDSYARHGLYGMMKLATHRDDYDEVVRQVAQRVVAAARRSAAGPWPVADFDALPNPFAVAAVPESGVARLFITVVAPRQSELPAGRDEQYYGSAAWDWAPYRPTSQQPVAEYTANFARSLGYQPFVSDLREREGDLLADGLVAHPELLIIDPWAVARPACQRLLARCNLADKPWVQVVLPWNPADRGTAQAERRLRRGLASALRHKLERGRVTSALAVDGVPSMGDFGTLLPLLIPAAGNRYLGHASAFPPDGSPVEKPTLHGFTPEPPNYLERTGA
jgi:FxsC-like protein